MRTPCQEAPEAWVGTDADLLAQAAKDCHTCPVYAACLAGKFGTPGPDDSGVWAGVNYVNGKPVDTQPQRKCDGCGNGAVRRADARFCSPRCYWNSRMNHDVPREKTCAVCSTTFVRGDRSLKNWLKATCCSNRCAGLARRKVKVAA